MKNLPNTHPGRGAPRGPGSRALLAPVCGDRAVAGDIQGGAVRAVGNLGIVKYHSRGQRVPRTNMHGRFNHFNSYTQSPWSNVS